jgi:hypothetical protein
MKPETMKLETMKPEARYHVCPPAAGLCPDHYVTRRIQDGLPVFTLLRPAPLSMGAAEILRRECGASFRIVPAV